MSGIGYGQAAESARLKLESEAKGFVNFGETDSVREASQVSMAISLKRIADALEEIVRGAHLNVDTYGQ